jgi:hypothetical protein
MKRIVAVAILLAAPLAAAPQVNVQIGLPALEIGLQIPAYPRMTPVPGYPVYYAPEVNANLFFYDGLYWALVGDTWYESPWYNGPWTVVSPMAVPAFVLRVPVRYYRAPPPWFHGWRAEAPPRWGEHWGGDWERRRAGWETWSHAAPPPRAPLPSYQKGYGGGRYPRPELQAALHDRNYGYWPREKEVRKAYQSHGMHGPPAARTSAPGSGNGHGHGKRNDH